MTATIKVSGIEQLNRNLKRISNSSRDELLFPALDSAGFVIKNRASDNIKSVTSGESTGIGAESLAVYRLRRTEKYIRVSVQVKKGAVNNFKRVKGQPVRIGLYLSVLEYGKKNQPPRSWIRKAAREGKNDALSEVRENISKNINSFIESKNS